MAVKAYQGDFTHPPVDFVLERHRPGDLVFMQNGTPAMSGRCLCPTALRKDIWPLPCNPLDFTRARWASPSLGIKSPQRPRSMVTGTRSSHLGTSERHARLLVKSYSM